MIYPEGRKERKGEKSSLSKDFSDARLSQTREVLRSSRDVIKGMSHGQKKADRQICLSQPEDISTSPNGRWCNISSREQDPYGYRGIRFKVIEAPKQIGSGD
jgi:hypothetical protein